MRPTFLFDFSRVLLFTEDKDYKGGLNGLYSKLSQKPGFVFEKHFAFNEPLLSFLKENKGKANLFIFTSGQIQKAPEIAPRLTAIFEKVFSAEDMGTHKQSSNAYLAVAKKIGKKPEDIIFVDDNRENVDAARQAGLNSILFTETKKVIRTLIQYLQ